MVAHDAFFEGALGPLSFGLGRASSEGQAAEDGVSPVLQAWPRAEREKAAGIRRLRRLRMEMVEPKGIEPSTS